jgi:hypothetical protein
MDDEIKNALFFIFSYAPGITEWMALKKELLKNLPAEKRKLFSTRDPKTKIQSTNSLEKSIIAVWKEITGKDLYLDRKK